MHIYIYTYIIYASHSKKFSSSSGPAIIPSGGFKVNSIEKKTHKILCKRQNHTFYIIHRGYLYHTSFINMIYLTIIESDINIKDKKKKQHIMPGPINNDIFSFTCLLVYFGLTS